MSNYMTLEELHQRLGQWIKENPERKNALISDSAVVQADDDMSYIPGSVLLRIEIENNMYATLTIIPPKTSPFVN